MTRRRSQSEQFAIVPVAVLDAEVSDGAVRLYAILRRYANSEGDAWPSIATLAERLRVDERTVKRRRKELVDAGLVVVDERFENGRQRSNFYRFPSLSTGGAQMSPQPGEGGHSRPPVGDTGVTQNESHRTRTARSSTGSTIARAQVADHPSDLFLAGTGRVGRSGDLSPIALAALEQLEAADVIDTPVGQQSTHDDGHLADVVDMRRNMRYARDTHTTADPRPEEGAP